LEPNTEDRKSSSAFGTEISIVDTLPSSANMTRSQSPRKDLSILSSFTTEIGSGMNPSKNEYSISVCDAAKRKVTAKYFWHSEQLRETELFLDFFFFEKL
jgi:hypothetical protein